MPDEINLKDYIDHVPNFPKEGILFYDISPLLANADAWQVTVGRLAKSVSAMQPDILVGVESRGFLVAAPLASKLGLGFILVRKKGKLPGETREHAYSLEYGADTIEIQENAIHKGQRVVVCDDLIATGGTVAATIELVEKMGGDVVGVASIIELAFLGGRKKIGKPLHAVLSYND